MATRYKYFFEVAVVSVASPVRWPAGGWKSQYSDLWRRFLHQMTQKGIAWEKKNRGNDKR